MMIKSRVLYHMYVLKWMAFIPQMTAAYVTVCASTRYNVVNKYIWLNCASKSKPHHCSSLSHSNGYEFSMKLPHFAAKVYDIDRISSAILMVELSSMHLITQFSIKSVFIWNSLHSIEIFERTFNIMASLLVPLFFKQMIVSQFFTWTMFQSNVIDVCCIDFTFKSIKMSQNVKWTQYLRIRSLLELSQCHCDSMQIICAM